MPGGCSPPKWECPGSQRRWLRKDARSTPASLFAPFVPPGCRNEFFACLVPDRPTVCLLGAVCVDLAAETRDWGDSARSRVVLTWASSSRESRCLGVPHFYFILPGPEIPRHVMRGADFCGSVLRLHMIFAEEAVGIGGAMPPCQSFVNSGPCQAVVHV